MLKKLIYSLFACLCLTGNLNSQNTLKFLDKDPLDNMPILESIPVGNESPAPIAKRGIEFRKFLAPSVKIAVAAGSGSGTIVHYDAKKNLAYVATCGHLWNGVMTAEEGKKKKLKCKIIVWYHNDLKLDAPRSYDANVIFYRFIEGAEEDTGLVTFTPDWVPNCFPIGPENYEYVRRQHSHSCGCDAGSEVAHYDIEMVGIIGNDLVTIKNSPRPGRSGGGLMNDEGQYIGTCWGTQYRDGTGKGFFTPLFAIHSFWKKQKDYVFLLEQKVLIGIADKLPIINRGTDLPTQGLILFPIK